MKLRDLAKKIAIDHYDELKSFKGSLVTVQLVKDELEKIPKRERAQLSPHIFKGNTVDQNFINSVFDYVKIKQDSKNQSKRDRDQTHRIAGNLYSSFKPAEHQEADAFVTPNDYFERANTPS